MDGLLAALLSPLTAGFLEASVRLATPILLAALGGLFAERSGILNVALDGTMLTGALAGFATTLATGNLWLGTVGGMMAGAAVSLLLAFYTIRLSSNQVVVGIALNLLAIGATSFVARVLYGTGTQQPRIVPFATIDLPGIGGLPLIGPLLHQSPLVYGALALVAFSHVALFRSSFGMRVLAAGEHPTAAETMGVSVPSTRLACVMISGVLAGMGGAFLSVSATGLFLDNMTAGRGYIALAIIVLGRRKPFGVLAAALLFGAADALQLRAQSFGVGVPFQLLLMLPYVLTIIVLAGFVRRNDAPAALGLPFERNR